MARGPFRIVLVTPYFAESRDVLERNILSVREQSHEATRILVADGQSQDWIEAHDVVHIRLPINAHGNGDTPRSARALQEWWNMDERVGRDYCAASPK